MQNVSATVYQHRNHLKNVISYALKLFWDSLKQGYLSHVEVDIREKISQY